MYASLLAASAKACTAEPGAQGAAELGGASALHEEIIATLSQGSSGCNDLWHFHAAIRAASLRGMGGMDGEEAAGAAGKSSARPWSAWEDEPTLAECSDAAAALSSGSRGWRHKSFGGVIVNVSVIVKRVPKCKNVITTRVLRPSP
jgi:hypothetical protein